MPTQLDSVIRGEDDDDDMTKLTNNDQVLDLLYNIMLLISLVEIQDS